jgi:hypothetical protein
MRIKVIKVLMVVSIIIMPLHINNIVKVAICRYI